MGLTTEITLAVAEQTGKEPEELPPLYRTVDVDALAMLVDDVERVEFRYAGCLVQFEAGEMTVSKESAESQS